MMRILVVGASGFIGCHLVAYLLGDGHQIICAGRDIAAMRRRFPEASFVAADFFRDGEADWLPRLKNVDAVINAAGALRGRLQTLHYDGPLALFSACDAADIGRVLQISALGAGYHPDSPFLSSKADVDAQFLAIAARAHRKQWCVVRPSIVIGRGGGSTALFCALAAVPWPIRLAAGNWRLQPIHVDDVAALVGQCLERDDLPPLLELAGPDVMTTDQLTSLLRAWLGLPERRFLTLAYPFLYLGALLGRFLPSSSLTLESLRLLQAGNTSDAAAQTVTNNGKPLSVAHRLGRDPATQADRWYARLLPMRGLTHAALAIVWIGSGLASFGVSKAQSGVFLAGLGLGGEPAYAITMAGAAWDTMLGIAMLFLPVRPIAILQLLTMGFYTILASVALPALWADPFGALLKNLAVLVATCLLIAMED